MLVATVVATIDLLDDVDDQDRQDHETGTPEYAEELVHGVPPGGGFGVDGRTRTCDSLTLGQVLYQR